MSNVYIVIEDSKDWKPYYPSANVVTAQEYLFGEHSEAPAGTRVINLCRGYKYLSLGYYCSLLAEARGHRVIPSVRGINDLSRKAIYSVGIEDLDALVDQGLAAEDNPDTDTFTLDVFFGRSAYPQWAEFARQLFETFLSPLLQVEFRRSGGRWRIRKIRSKALHKLDERQEDLFAEALDAFSRYVWRKKARRPSRYDLAILYNPDEALPPSDRRALANFVRVGRSLGLDVELIQKRDYASLAEYDALFIRETTAVSNHTYRFAKQAEREGLVVIDDPTSIMRCTNKVYLADLLRKNKVPA